jgi:hypothetical protein
MRKSWLTAASALAAIAVEAPAVDATTLFTNPNALNFGDVRIGTTSSENASFDLKSTVTSGAIDAATAPFSGGPYSFSGSAKTTVTRSFSFTPTVSGAASDSVGISAKNSSKVSQTGSLTLKGTGVGPQYQSIPAPGATIDFGKLAPGASGVEDLLISNVSTDAGKPALTGLTLVESTLGGSLDFSLGNFSAGSVLHKGDSFDLKIDFSSLTPGIETGTLELVTDQDAAFGGIGQIFEYSLSADVVAPAPEPASLGLFGSALAGLGIVLHRRRRG